MKSFESQPPSVAFFHKITSLLDRLRPAAIYLFGSAARGTSHPNSDIDIAFLPSFKCNPLEVFEMSNRLSEVLGKDVDLIDLRNASTVMAKEVLRSGKLIAENDPSHRMQFEMRTLADYARLSEERKPILLRLGLAKP